MSPQSSEKVEGIVGGSQPLDKEEVIELLGQDDEEQPLELPKPQKKEEKEEREEEKPEKEKEGEEEEPDELKAIEEELEEPSEEDLELVTPVRRREILKVYPDLFKKFPYLEKAYYRDQQFTEILPTIQDAKTAVEKAAVLDGFEKEIMSGDISTVLSAVKEEDAETFNKIVDNYLPTLQKIDEKAYYHILGNVIKDTILTMAREAGKLGEDNGQPLRAAAQILNQFVFGTNTFEAPKRLSRDGDEKENEREAQLKEREQKIIMGQFESTRDDLQTRVDNVLKATIEGNIDPKNTMTDYVKRTAIREATETLDELILKDARFRNLLDRLWEKSFEENFSRASTDRIKSAYLSKAKTLLPTVIKKARNEALRGLGKRVSDEEESDRRGPITPGRSTTHTSGKIKSAKDIPKDMKTIDFLNQD